MLLPRPFARLAACSSLVGLMGLVGLLVTGCAASADEGATEGSAAAATEGRGAAA
jgi:hypothetical protein